jgi:type VI secretion system protein VasJ
LQRYSWTALKSLGSPYQPAKAALLIELQGWLRRMPSVVDLVANDGTPFADARTQEWIQREVGSASLGLNPAATSLSQAPANGETSFFADAKALFDQGKQREAIELLEARAKTATSGQARFRTRLLLAQFCRLAGHSKIAAALFTSLDRAAVQHHLHEWDPGLAAEYLEGLLLTVREMHPGPLPPQFAEQYERLSVLALPIALRIQP